MSLSLHTLSPHPKEHEAVHRSHGDNKGTILSPFPILSRYLLYLSIGHSWNERRRDRAAHGFHPPNEKELRSSIFARIHRSSPDLSKGTFSLSLFLSHPPILFLSPRFDADSTGQGPRLYTLYTLLLSLSRGPNQQPTQQEVRRVEEEEREERRSTWKRRQRRRKQRRNRLAEQTADKPGCTGEKREGGRLATGVNSTREKTTKKKTTTRDYYE